MEPQVDIAAPESRRRSPARTALRMAVYPALAVALAAAAYFNPRVREEYYYWRWQYAREEADKKQHFKSLLATTANWRRRYKYVGRRAAERLPEFRARKGRWFYRMIRRGYGSALVPALIKALGDKDEIVRTATAYALGEIGPATKTVVLALVKALSDKHEYVREAAAGALGRISPGAKAAVPALEKARQDPVARVRRAAAAALKKIAKNAARENNKEEGTKLQRDTVSISGVSTLSLSSLVPVTSVAGKVTLSY